MMTGSDAAAPVAAPANLAPQALRRRIEETQAGFDRQFLQGAEATALIRSRAHFIDSLLSEIFHAIDWPDPRGLALVAAGGYGRGELHRHSDIDLLVLLATEADATMRAQIEAFLTLLWDLNLEIGHSVRTVTECRELAETDLTILTNLTESRTIVGSERLRLAMSEAIASDKLWPSREFFEGKLAEQRERHQRYDNIEYNLEPNVKYSPGGLRDLQMIGWVAKRHFGTSDLEHLVGLGFLTASELLLLIEGRQFLWKVRWGLHMLAERGENRLLLDYQRELAQLFDYTDDDAKLAVEHFMHDYYSHVLVLRELNDVVLQHFAEVIVRANEEERVEPLNDRFQIHNDYIEAVAPDLFRQMPCALLELFVLMANRADIQGVRAATIRQIRESIDVIDDAFRHDPENTRLFMALLRSPHKLVSQLTRMRRYGVLGRYVPEFGRVVGQMQHDLFHIYTVDAHTMQVIRNLRRFRNRASQEVYPVAYHCAKNVPKMELLYIAGLYHDIAKGRGGDHSELGADDARAFCTRHRLAASDTELVCWLVRQHLVMSATAQRKDISDPDVIHEFANEVGCEARLDYLYALTVADINATNPTLWNSWRATLLRQLYTETRRALRRGLERYVDRQDHIAATREAALAKLIDKGVRRERIIELWEYTDEDYFLHNDHNTIAWQMTAVAGHDLQADGPLVLIRDQSGQVSDYEGATEIFIYTRDHPNLFAATVAALDQANLSVHNARLHTSARELCFNSYMVLDETGRSVGDDARRVSEIRDTLRRVLAGPDRFPEIVDRRIPRKLRHFNFPTEVEIANDPATPYTDLRLVAADRPGLLARIGMIFLEQGINLQSAKIATLGERIDDVFFITDETREPITDSTRLEALRRTICERLDEETRALSRAR